MNMMSIELFCGMKSWSKVAARHGMACFTADIDSKFYPDLCKDILDTEMSDIPKQFWRPDYLWASPPCTFFSVASIGRHWHEDHRPKTEQAVLGLKILDKTIRLIHALEPKAWFIENPRGKMRKVIDGIFIKNGFDMTKVKRYTVTYCQYGLNIMKPTDIWTNLMDWNPRPMCNYGDKCHMSAPRGSSRGVEGIKDKAKKAVVPDELCEELLGLKK
jgi:hypothetical protein